MTPFLLLRKLLDERLAPAAKTWFMGATGALADGASNARFCALLSLASRHARRVLLAPSATDLRTAGKVIEGWNPERWTLLETLRVALVLARTDLEEDDAVLALDEAFRYADEGETCALLRVLALLPEPQRFVRRAGAGCRSNMRSVFEAAALDTPYPVRHFDDVAWNQCVIKCLFVGAPLWRLWGLDTRLTPELARMALDLADERRSAGRPVPPELWLCLGTAGGSRGHAALEQELAGPHAGPATRCAAALAFARAGDPSGAERLAREERDPAALDLLGRVISGDTDATMARYLPA
jgi:hypothetical protein